MSPCPFLGRIGNSLLLQVPSPGGYLQGVFTPSVLSSTDQGCEKLTFFPAADPYQTTVRRHRHPSQRCCSPNPKHAFSLLVNNDSLPRSIKTSPRALTRPSTRTPSHHWHHWHHPSHVGLSPELPTQHTQHTHIFCLQRPSRAPSLASCEHIFRPRGRTPSPLSPAWPTSLHRMGQALPRPTPASAWRPSLPPLVFPWLWPVFRLACSS